MASSDIHYEEQMEDARHMILEAAFLLSDVQRRIAKIKSQRLGSEGRNAGLPSGFESVPA